MEDSRSLDSGELYFCGGKNLSWALWLSQKGLKLPPCFIVSARLLFASFCLSREKNRLKNASKPSKSLPFFCPLSLP